MKKKVTKEQSKSKWDWVEVQKFCYGFLGLKPNEFWELQPKDIILMNEGFQMKQDYKDSLHLETLRLLRYIAYTSYIAIPTKKQHKKSSLTKFYPLRNDPKSKVLTKDEAKEFFTKKDALITNGKMRGYKSNNSNELFNKEGDLIGYVKENIIEYIN